MEIGSRIKQIRKQLKMSQKEFASSVGMSQGHLCVTERGEFPLSITLIKAICHEYKLNEDWIRTGNGEPFTSITQEKGIPVFSQLPESYPEISRPDELRGYLSIPGLHEDGFAFYQRGDYMVPTILARDLVICEPANSLANDDLVLLKNKWGTWIVRRFRKMAGKTMLTPDNFAYTSFEYDEREQFILAKVCQVLRNVNF